MGDSTVDYNTGALSTEKTPYRRYVKFGTVTEGDTTKTIITEQRIAGEIATKDKKTGLSQNWQKAEDDGLNLFSENEIVSYTAKSLEGFQSLVPDPEQQMYIINAGLSSIQTSKVQAFMKANVENASEPTPEFNQVTLDLRVGLGDEGDYSIQKAPQRRSLTDQEKLEKTLKSLNLAPEQLEALLLSVASSMAVQK